jgi:hypothetical protein
MSNLPTLELMEKLQRSVRRWKTLALTLLVGLGLVIVCGASVAGVKVERARRAEMEARQAEMEARHQAERVRQAAEDALREAR